MLYPPRFLSRHIRIRCRYWRACLPRIGHGLHSRDTFWCTICRSDIPVCQWLFPWFPCAFWPLYNFSLQREMVVKGHLRCGFQHYSLDLFLCRLGYCECCVPHPCVFRRISLRWFTKMVWVVRPSKITLDDAHRWLWDFWIRWVAHMLDFEIASSDGRLRHDDNIVCLDLWSYRAPVLLTPLTCKNITAYLSLFTLSMLLPTLQVLSQLPR